MTERTTAARHVNRRSMPSLYEAEAQLWAHDQELSELVEKFDELCDVAARAKSDWEEHRDRTIIYLSDREEKMAADQRLARAKLAMSARGIPGEDLYRAHLITEAAEKSCGRKLTAVQSQLSSVQTLVNGLRKVTGVT